jgi:hypothetical protein
LASAAFAAFSLAAFSVAAICAAAFSVGGALRLGLDGDLRLVDGLIGGRQAGGALPAASLTSVVSASRSASRLVVVSSRASVSLSWTLAEATSAGTAVVISVVWPERREGDDAAGDDSQRDGRCCDRAKLRDQGHVFHGCTLRLSGKVQVARGWARNRFPGGAGWPACGMGWRPRGVGVGCAGSTGRVGC